MHMTPHTTKIDAYRVARRLAVAATEVQSLRLFRLVPLSRFCPTALTVPRRRSRIQSLDD